MEEVGIDVDLGVGAGVDIFGVFCSVRGYECGFGGI